MWAEKYPGTLSEANLEKINLKRPLAPIVDAKWLEHFPEHQNYLNEILIHHHLEFGNKIYPLPKTLHGEKPGFGIFHYKDKN